LTAAGVAALAACGAESGGSTGQIPIAGERPGFVPLPAKPVTDTVLLRTAGSFEWSLVDAYSKILQNGFLTDPTLVALVEVFQSHHLAHASIFAAATTTAGGTACTGLNVKMTADLFQPIIQAIAASPDPEGDSIAFANALENLAGSTHQSFVPTFSQPALRRTAMSVASVEGRHAAVFAALVNPEVLVSSGAAPAAETETAPTTTVVTGLPTTAPGQTTTTTLAPATQVNTIVAIPGAFGSLAAIPLTVGPVDATGNRTTFSLQTPSLNSFIYDDETC
jgi:hypothetical protein